MDPVTAVGLASAILTFVEVGFKFIQTANEIHNSADGVLEKNRRIEDISVEVEQAATGLEIMATSDATQEQKSLYKAAQRCRKTSTELATILNKLKPKKSSPNRLEAMKYAFNAVLKVDTIKELEDQLKEDRNELIRALAVLSRAEAADGFKKLLFLAKTNETKLDSLTQALEHLRQAQLSMIDNEAFSNFQELLTVGSQVRRAISQDRILHNIKFDELYLRYEAVHVAHENTFNWIHEASDTVQGGDSSRSFDLTEDSPITQQTREMQCESREKFINWLSRSDPSSPVFHISGKLGSGKSTLMKFLCCHTRTVQELNKWAGTNRLVFASFFFWRNGTVMQKSLAGLCRALLYEVLKQRPDLIPDTLPDYWNKAEQTPGIASISLDFPRALIENAFNRLLQNPQLGDKDRFCFFIDGLDEFEPGRQDGLDYTDLVGILRKWTTHANGNLKLCVSSREECVFMDEYRNYPGFRLQDLTRFDMQDYVRSRLSSLKNETLRDKFIDLIPEKSSGIFLWTYLVVKTVRNKISHKVSDRELEKYLKTLPEDLKALFQHVLDNLEPDDRTWTLRAIRLLQTAKSKGLQFTLPASSLLEEYVEDPEFSMWDDVSSLQKDQETLRTRLRGACGGLIEHFPDDYSGLDTLDFVHRSVPDMFQGNIKTNELSSQMEEALHGMDIFNALIHLSFAVVRTQQLDNDRFRLYGEIERMVVVLLTESGHGPPYHFVEFINTWIGNAFNIDTLHDTPGLTWTIESNMIHAAGMLFISYKHMATAVFADAVLIAIATDRSDYIEWKIQHDPTTLRTPLRRALVGWCLLRSKHWKLFFRNDVFSRDSTVPLRPTHPITGMLQPQLLGDFDPLTAWQFLLVTAILHDQHGQYDYSYLTLRQFDAFPEVVEQFLRQGNDPYCQIKIFVGKDYKAALKVLFRDVESYHFWTFSRDTAAPFGRWLQFTTDRCQELQGRPRLDLSTELKEEYSLREIISATEWPNRDAILKLMDNFDRSQDLDLI